MGIASLLPQLKSVTAKAHVSKYRGKRAAVDAYVLLHRGAYTCAREIVEGEPSDRRVLSYNCARSRATPPQPPLLAALAPRGINVKSHTTTSICAMQVH